LETGATNTVTFDSPGTVSYLCEIHPDMTGIVTVN
jgi:plastocyanin